MRVSPITSLLLDHAWTTYQTYRVHVHVANRNRKVRVIISYSPWGQFNSYLWKHKCHWSICVCSFSATRIQRQRSLHDDYLQSLKSNDGSLSHLTVKVRRHSCWILDTKNTRLETAVKSQVTTLWVSLNRKVEAILESFKWLETELENLRSFVSPVSVNLKIAWKIDFKLTRGKESDDSTCLENGHKRQIIDNLR